VLRRARTEQAVELRVIPALSGLQNFFGMSPFPRIGFVFSHFILLWRENQIREWEVATIQQMVIPDRQLWLDTR
jgi:hypothetical protein